jgi:hypothetical protein
MIKGNDINPIGFLGNSVKVHLKLGGAFYLKVTTVGADFLSGYDQEGINILVQTNDIDFIIS